jgi:6-phosphogluconolactonase
MACDREIITTKNLSDLSSICAGIFTTEAASSVKEKGSFVVALSGGSTPRSTHRLLAEEPLVSRVPWEGTHIFWVDERCVPVDDPASNYGAAREDLLDHAPVPSTHVHPMPSQMSPVQGARRYQEELITFFQLGRGQFPVFDLIVLGIGKDGHTASLFPGQGALEEGNRLVAAVRGGNPYVDRLTMTVPVLILARHILFLVSGGDKAGILKTLLEGGDNTLPAQRIRPLKGRLTWLVDTEAAALLCDSR